MKDSDSEHKDFLVIGLGASAGGVRALQTFFSTMPPNSGMAFVVILHLAPQYESNLAAVLGTQTQMPVIQVNETHKVEPNHVYVIPPNQQLEMIDGVVRPAELKHENGSRTQIDVFFRTLADAYKSKAVCVVLSGTGSDGTLGLKRIKESNGFAIVQDPANAEYDAMPRSAIATGLADWVLPVVQMPEKLIAFRESSERLHLTADDPQKIPAEIQAEESLREILTILRVRTGHDFSNYKTPTLVRRVARHLQIHELPDIPSYLAFLRETPEEVISLHRNLLINVTNFFRDREAFAKLEQEVIPTLFAGKTSRETARVWSAGCASGEEAYSLAMLLSEYAVRMNDPPKIQIFATDVDDEAIIEAREHLYTEAIEADVSPERLKRFFLKEGDRYRIKKELRETVLFAPHNILRDPPFSKLDLITCRNLLIYLNRETQERVMEIFHFALAHNGYLFLGSSETAETVPNLFNVIDKKCRIYQRRASLHAQTAPQMPVLGRWQINLPEDKKRARETDTPFSLGELHYKLLERFAPPSVLVNQDFDILYMSESVGRYLRFAGGEPSKNLLKLVHPDLLPDLRAALFSVQRERKSAESQNIRIEIEDKETLVNVIVRAVDAEDENSSNFLLVIFDEAHGEKTALSGTDRKTSQSSRASTKDEATEAVIARLEEDLRRTKGNLRATIEQHEISIEELKASNEELQAINEELRSAGEELETSKEELQSINEELITLNTELKEKNDEAARTNSDLQNLIAATDIATIFLDRNLRIKRYTPQVEEFFNITTNDTGRPLEHFTHRLNYEDLVADSALVLRKLTTLEREISDKNNRYYLARFLPYRTVDDRIDGVVLNFIDITERREIEEALRLSEENLRLLIESVTEHAIFTVDKQRRVMMWNSGAEQVFGWTSEEIVGQSVDIIFTPEDRENNVLEKEMETALAEGRASDDRWHVRKDGSHFFVNGALMPLSNGRTKGFVKIARDLTKQREAQEILRASEERLKLATEAAALGSWDWDFRTNVLVWSKELFEIFGLEPSADMTIDFENAKPLFHPEDLPRLVETSRKAKENHESFRMEYRIRRKDTGEERWIAAHESFFYDEENKLVRGVGVAQDITERKAAEEILLRSRELLEIAVDERTKELATANLSLANEISERQQISLERVRLLQQIVKTQEDERKRIARDMHDHLGQRLVALRLKLETLREMCDGDALLCEMVDGIQRIANLIDSDVDFISRELRPTVLDDLGLKVALNNYVAEWSEHFNIPAEFHAQGLQDKRLPADIETHLYRLTQEALNNAAKHSGATKVDVLIENRDHTVILIIEDNGQGFEVNEMKMSQSKGLGLVGMRERAALMGGTLEIETSKGNGTTIFARIPLKTSDTDKE